MDPSGIVMAGNVLKSPVDGTMPTHDYTDDDKLAVVSDEDDAVASGASDDEEQPKRNEQPIIKQLNDFRKRVLDELDEINWNDVWKRYPLIGDKEGQGQSENDGRTALHMLVAEHNQVRGTDSKASQALVQAIANVSKRYPGLITRLDNSHKTPLYEAISNERQAKAVRHMVRNCCLNKSHLATKDHPLSQAIAVQIDYNSRKENALHIAFRKMPRAVDMPTLKLMCQHATEEAVAHRDVQGFTPLHYAVTYKHASEEQFELIQELLSKGEATREDPEKIGTDVLDHYATQEGINAPMSVYEYHVWTRETKDREVAASSARGKRSGKDGDSGKSGRHNDKRRETEQATVSGGHRPGATGPSHSTSQSSGGPTNKQSGDAIQPDRPIERVRDERTGGRTKLEPAGQKPKGSDIRRDDKYEPGKQSSQSRPVKQGGHRVIDDQRYDQTKEPAAPNIGITRSNTGAPAPVKAAKVVAPTESPEEKKKRRDEWSEMIKKELKTQILRSRPFEQATRFLYGKNLSNTHIYFEYQGQSTIVDPSTFETSFRSVQFDSILKYVAFPYVKVREWDKDKRNPYKNMNIGGRSDMLFFFKWLQKKGVRRILRVIVDDVHPDGPPHSDEAIELCLQGLGVEVLEWRKLNLDPDTICRIDRPVDEQVDGEDVDANGEDSHDESRPKAPVKGGERFTGTLRTIHLLWNGDNAVLRGWSDPEGLRSQLPNLSRIELATRNSLESKDRTERNIAAFKLRMRTKIDKAPPRKSSLKVDTSVGATGIVKEERHVSFVPPKTKEIEVYSEHVGQATGSQSHNVTQERDFSLRVSHKWLKSTDDFGKALSRVWKKLVADRNDKPKDIVVALIDDGVDNTDIRLQGKILPGRTFSSDKDRIRPWYVSEKGHGTLMATSICRVCPMAKIYPIRLHTTGDENSWQSSIDAESALKAIQAAVDMGVDIISMSWTIKAPPEALQPKFKTLIEKASSNTLMFCAAADGGHMSGLHYPAAFSPGSFIRVGAAKADGLPYEKVGELNDVEFIMPGVDVMPPDTSAGSAKEVRDRSHTGSSVAAALGSGLAAMVLYCLKIALLSGREGINQNDLDLLHKTQEMKKAIERFGMSKSKDSGYKFVEVFNALDDKTPELGPNTAPDKARDVVAGLARNFVRR